LNVSGHSSVLLRILCYVALIYGFFIVIYDFNTERNDSFESDTRCNTLGIWHEFPLIDSKLTSREENLYVSYVGELTVKVCKVYMNE